MSWPSFSFPFGAWFFLAVIPLVVLYFLKLKRPRMEISSLALWQSVVNDQRVNSPFQKFRRNLLLLLQLILLTLVILALMQPFISAGPETAEFLPVLIDCSASMSSKANGSDQTRLDIAVEQVKGMIDNLRGHGKIALFTFSSGGRRLTEFTDDSQMLLRALEKVQPTDRASKLDEVLRMAEAYSRTSAVDRVIVITDGNLNEQVDFELPFKLDIQRVSAGDSNLGITEMSARRSGPESWDVFVRVSGSSTTPTYADLRLLKNGEMVGKETIVAASDDSERVVFSVDSKEAALLQATLTINDFDSLEVDNSVWLNIPTSRPLKVRAAAELYSWQHALSVQPEMELDTATEPSAPEYDLIVSDTEDLKGATAPIIVYNGLVPKELQDLIAVTEVKADDTPVQIIDWLQTAPLLRHVQLRDVQIGEKTRFVGDADTQQLEERGYEILIHGAEGPLMLQRRRGLETEYYFLFHTDRSTLPYRVAFPILVSNIIESALQRASLSEVAASPTGVLPALNVDPNREFQIRGPNPASYSVTSTPSGLLMGVQAERVGKYDVFDGEELVASVGTGLLSSLETSLRSVDEIQFSEVSVSTDEAQVIDSDRHLWWTFAFLAFIFLLLEWWYFQRVKGTVAA